MQLMLPRALAGMSFSSSPALQFVSSTVIVSKSAAAAAASVFRFGFPTLLAAGMASSDISGDQSSSTPGHDSNHSNRNHPPAHSTSDEQQQQQAQGDIPMASAAPASARADNIVSETASSTTNVMSNPSHTNYFKMIQHGLSSPRPRASLLMTLSMALHFGGYEFARSGMLALFTSKELGFAGSAAYPFAMGLVSPFSLLLLMGYGYVLERQGPRAALRKTSLFSLGFLGSVAVLLKLLAIAIAGTTTTATLTALRAASKAVVGLGFVYQNSFAHLLYTQHWSFLSSVMTPDEGSVWFASIAGLSSIFCTLTGSVVKPLVGAVGLIGVLACTCVTLALSTLCGDRAYQLSQENGFDPAALIEQKQTEKEQIAEKQREQPQSVLGKAKSLFRRIPTLGALACETLSFQALSVILSVCMITQLKASLPLDDDRAAWTGQFFASVNAISGLLQFIILPLFMKRIEPSLVWKFMPLLPVACSMFQSAQRGPSLAIMAFSFFVTKTMDYSIRGVVNEMVYQPLDFDSRYLGKEIIGVFGSRFGKSGVSLLLSVLTYLFADFGVNHLSKLSVVASISWFSSSWWLSTLVPRKAQAQKAYLEQRTKKTPTASDPQLGVEPEADAKTKVE